ALGQALRRRGLLDRAVDFGWTSANGWTPLVSAGGDDIFVAKFDLLGKPVLSERFGDAQLQNMWGLAVHDSGAIAITGTLEGPSTSGAASRRSPPALAVSASTSRSSTPAATPSGPDRSPRRRAGAESGGGQNTLAARGCHWLPRG